MRQVLRFSCPVCHIAWVTWATVDEEVRCESCGAILQEGSHAGYWCEFCQSYHSAKSCTHPGQEQLRRVRQERDMWIDRHNNLVMFISRILGRDVPPEFSLVDQGGLTEEDIQRGQQLAKEHGW